YPNCVLGAKFKEKNKRFSLLLTSHGRDLDDDYSRYKSSYIYRQVKNSLAKVDGFVALNTSLKERFIKVNQSAAVLETTNGADILQFPKKGEDSYILYLGRLSKRKGVELLISSFSL